MIILLIGNGFDLEHKLPTSYKDFLDFCKKVRYVYTFKENVNVFREIYLDDWHINNSIKETLRDAFENRKIEKVYHEDETSDDKITTNNRALDELFNLINQNAWIEYFYVCSSNMGDNWIDLESEIARVVRALDTARYQLEYSGSALGTGNIASEILMTLLKAAKGSWKSSYRSVKDIDEFTDFLCIELERLIRALEIYIAEFIDKIEVTQKSSDIEKLNPDHILSFNYSDTYKRVYGVGKSIQYDYIHGKADISKNVKSCNMVLGIDEYLGDNEKNKKLEFLAFKKYYQRIYKSTGNAYLDWVDEIKDSYSAYLDKLNDTDEEVSHSQTDNELDESAYDQKICWKIPKLKYPQHTLYIFGHSLDITDKDILKMLICNDNVQTKIFYYRKNEDDKKALGNMIRNLIKIMGADELIRRTGGVHRTIEFIPQKVTKIE